MQDYDSYEPGRPDPVTAAPFAREYDLRKTWEVLRDERDRYWMPIDATPDGLVGTLIPTPWSSWATMGGAELQRQVDAAYAEWRQYVSELAIAGVAH